MEAKSKTDQLRHEVDRITHTGAFKRSPVLTKLLRYLADEAVAGRGELIKAYSIAVDGLDRDESFDPQTDSYPRVQVGRLRKALALFYAKHGVSSEGCRVELPLGSYALALADQSVFQEDQPGGQRVAAAPDQPPAQPEVEWAGAPQNPIILPPVVHTEDKDKPGQPGWWSRHSHLAAWIVASVLAVVLLVGVGLTWLAGPDAGGDPSDNGLASSPFDGPTVFVEPADGEQDQSGQTSWVKYDLEARIAGFEWIEVGSDFDRAESPRARANSYLLEFRTEERSSGEQLRLSLISLDDRDLIWARQYNLGSDDAAQNAALDEIVASLAHSFGVIGTDQRRRYTGSYEQGYHCLLRYEEYRRFRDPAMQLPVSQCLAASAAADPDNIRVLGALSFLNYVQVPTRGEEAAREGRRLATRAMQIDSNSVVALAASARAAYIEGNCSLGARQASRALAVNPLNPEMLALFGAYALGCGQLDDAERLLSRAVQLDPEGPDFMWASLTFLYVSRNQPEQALQAAESMIYDPGRPQPYYHIAKSLAFAANNDVEGSRDQWRMLAEAFGESPSMPPEQLLGRFIAAQRVIAMASRELRRSNVLPAAGPATP